MHKFALIFLLASGISGTLLSQESRVPAPILQQPSDPMAWRMKREHSSLKSSVSTRTASPNAKRSEPVSLDYIFSGGLTKIAISFEDGSHREYWKAAQTVLCRVGSSSEIQALSDKLPRYPCAAHGFYGIENVKPEHAQGLSRWDNKDCRYFHGKRPATILENPPLSNEPSPVREIEYEAWFDVQSGLPRAYRAEGKTWVFEFSPAPNLVMPAEWQTELDKYCLQMRRAGLAR